MSDVERIWKYARRRGRVNSGPTQPGPGMRAVVLALAQRSFYGRELAAHIGYAAPPVSRWLHKLQSFRLAEIDRTVPSARGGRPAEYWVLTEDGRELAEALRAELLEPLKPGDMPEFWLVDRVAS